MKSKTTSKIKKPSYKCKAVKKQRCKSKHISVSYPHFRYYKKSKHPALVIGEQPIEEYRYRKVMHGEKDGNKNNEKIEPNPNLKDNEPMFISNRVRHDKKVNFENKPLPWECSKKDRKK